MTTFWSNIIIQLGVSALVIFVGFKLAMRLIAAWTAAEKERNATLAQAEKDRTAAIATGFKALVDSFSADLKDVVATLRQGFSECRNDTKAIQRIVDRLEGKFDQVLDLTPVRQMTAMHEGHREPKVIIDSDLHSEETTPPAGPSPKRTKTPPAGQPYGPFTRPKTSG